MTVHRSLATRSEVGAAGADLRKRGASLIRRVAPAIHTARSSVSTLTHQLPGAVVATRAVAERIAATVQAMPSSTLRSLTAGSLGLGVGLYFGGAPRLVSAAAVAPAVFMGASLLARPPRADAGRT